MKRMMLFRLKNVPDFSLNKYQADNIGGVEGVLEHHKEFLRQWNRKGILSGTSLHFFYQYDPQKEYGDRLDFYVGVMGEDNNLSNVIQMMEASPLLQLYSYEIQDLFWNDEQSFGESNDETDFNISISGRDNDEYLRRKGLLSNKYNKMCAITKRELFVMPSSTAVKEAKEEYYSIAQMVSAERGRLFMMFSMMEKLNLPVLYRVDLYPVDVSDQIRDSFKYTFECIEEKRNKRDGMMSGYGNGTSEKRLLDKYEDIIEKIENEPHCICNFLVFGRKETTRDDSLQLLADSIATESIEEGNYSLTTFYPHDEINAFSFLKDDVHLESEDGMHYFVSNGKKGNLIYHKKAHNISLKFLPVLWTLNELQPFCRLPVIYENEEIQKAKETRISLESVDPGIDIGKDEYGRNVRLPYSSLMKHVFIAGASGSGKTFALLEIISKIAEDRNRKRNEEHKEGINFLIFEPAKKEYRALLNTKQGEDVILLSPHLHSMFPIQINPFEFPKGIVLSQHIGVLMKVFESSFELPKSAYEVLDSAIENAYVEKGWEIDESNLGEKVYPTLSDVYEQIEHEVDKYEYSEESKGQIKGFTHLRLGGLMKRDAGEIFNVVRSTWTPEEWLEASVIIELEALAEQDRNFFVLLVCALIHETLLATVTEEKDVEERKLKHVIIIDEAHNIIAPESYQSTANDAPDPKISASAFIAKMLAEVRALGEGIIIADQLPSSMAPEVVKNTVSKFALKLVAQEDRAIMGDAMMASGQQVENLLSFEVGKALYYGSNMKKPIELHFNKWRGSIKSLSDVRLCESIYKKPECGMWLRYIWLYYLDNLFEAMMRIKNKYQRMPSKQQERQRKISEELILKYKTKLRKTRSYWKLEDVIENEQLYKVIYEAIERIEIFRLEEEADEDEQRT